MIGRISTRPTTRTIRFQANGASPREAKLSQIGMATIATEKKTAAHTPDSKVDLIQLIRNLSITN